MAGMIKSFGLSSTEQAIHVSRTLACYWYRGQPRRYNDLSPNVFRHEYRSNSCFLEQHYGAIFQSEAYGVASDLPAHDDDVGWLLLMQHHGCATRLLDWSESILVALYFAARDNYDHDAELWCLHPGDLNKKRFGDKIILDASAVDVQALARESVAAIDEHGERKTTETDLPEHPLAFAPGLWFRRGVNQLNRFTIHPHPGRGKSLTESLSYPSLVRYLIPKEKKREMADDLYSLGIRPQTMFPDLDGAARGVYAFADRLSRGVVPCNPKPPVCDGEC
ncbi:MAG: FRG domain-containing protein [Pirellulaceae bacterium]